MPSAQRSAFRRLSAAVALVAVLLGSSVAPAQDAKKEPAGKKADPLEKKTKNYSIPWVVTLLSLSAIVVPVAMASRRLWELPFDSEDEDEKKK